MSGRSAGDGARCGQRALDRTFLAALILCCNVTHAGDLSRSPSVAFSSGSEVECPVTLVTRSPLSIDRAVDLALCNNAEVRVAWANIRVQSAAVGVARAAYWPTLSASVSELNERTGYSEPRLPATETTEKTVYGSFDWRLFDFGGRSGQYRAARSLLAAAIASRDATIQQVLGTVVQAYFDAITARAVLEDKTDSVSTARDTLASAERREAEGDAARNDALQARAALERARLDLNQSEADYQKTLAELVYALGVPAGSPILLPGDIEAPLATDHQNLAAWLKVTERRHPAIIAAQAAVQAARDQVASARSADRPTVDLTANYYQNGFPNEGLTTTNMRSATVGLTVTVPLFDGFLTHFNIEQAQATVRVKEEQLREARQETFEGVVQTYADAESALRNLDVSVDLLNAAQAAFESSQRRYTEGVADIVELLNAQAAFADARTERTRCVAGWRSARLRLLASAGVLDGEELGE